jgi:heat shock protein HslJ
VIVRRSLALLTLLPLILVACADEGDGSSDGGSTDPADLTGVTWQLDGSSIASLVGDSPPDAVVTLEFADGQAAGRAACNSYGGAYQAGDDGTLSFELFAVTQMACDEPLMALERAYLAALGQVTGFSVEIDLVLTGGDVPLTFSATPPPEPLPLVGTAWTLTTIASGDAVSSTITGTETTAELAADGSIAGSAGCNQYSGTYTEGEGGLLSFSAFATTKMMCAEDVMAQEAAFLSAMEQVAGYAIEGTQLSLLDASGAMLLAFEGA